MIQSISAKTEADPSAGALIELLTGATHNFEEGATVMLSEVVGMVRKADSLNSINGMTFKVTQVCSRNSFVIDCDTSQFTAYERNGVAKNVKTKQVVKFAPIRQVLASLDATYFTSDWESFDFCKMENY